MLQNGAKIAGKDAGLWGMVEKPWMRLRITGGRWYTAAIRPLLALPVVIFLWKVIVWDKVLGLGTTDEITGMAADWCGLIVTAYVGGRSIEKVARILRR